MIRRQNRIKT